MNPTVDYRHVICDDEESLRGSIGSKDLIKFDTGWPERLREHVGRQ